MVDATIERRGARDATEPDAATRLRDVIQRILEATDPAQAMAALGLAQAADGWRDARRLLVSPWVRQAATRRRSPRWRQWSPPTPRAWTSAACSPACWAAPSNGTAPSPRPTPPPASRPKTPACTPRAYTAARSGRRRGRARAPRTALAAPADAHWWMLAYARHGDAAEAAGIAAALDATNLPNARWPRWPCAPCSTTTG